MIAKHIIAHNIPEVTLSDSAVNVHNLMDEYGIEHLPVVEAGLYVGLVCGATLAEMDLKHNDMLLGNVELMEFKVRPEDHVFDVLRMATVQDLTLIPVVDSAGNYRGAITLPNLLNKLAESLGVDAPGGIIILELNSRDYALQEIAGVVEGNDAKVLSLQVTPVPDSTQLFVTLKVNKPDINGILQTFNRYGYSVSASFQEDVYSNDMQLRYEELMRYMNL